MPRGRRSSLRSCSENELVPQKFYFALRRRAYRQARCSASGRASPWTHARSSHADRTVRQYTDEQYIPAATAYARRACGDSELTASFLAWQEEIAANWNDVHFGALDVSEQEGDLVFCVQVYLGALDPNSIRVELYADSHNGSPAFKQEMHQTSVPERSSEPHLYMTRIRTTRPANDFTTRILPHHALALPTENRRILWQR